LNTLWTEKMTEPNFRALCAELADSVELLLDMRQSARPLLITEDRLNRVRAALAEQPVGPTDDQIDELWDKEAGYYELYEEVRNVVRTALDQWGQS
jgi:hypothetical protein